MRSTRSIKKLVRFRQQQQRLSELQLQQRRRELDSAIAQCLEIQQQLETQSSQQLDSLSANPAAAWTMRDSILQLQQQLQEANEVVTACRQQMQEAQEINTQRNIELESCKELQRRSDQRKTAAEAAQQGLELQETVLGQAFRDNKESTQ